MFDHVSKHLKFSLKNSAAPCLSTSVLSVWKHDQTLVRVFDILHTYKCRSLSNCGINKTVKSVVGIFFIVGRELYLQGVGWGGVG